MAWHDELFAAGASLPRVRRIHAVFRTALNHAVARQSSLDECVTVDCVAEAFEVPRWVAREACVRAV